MEPMWPDSVGWFTFCQTRVCEAQKNWLASRKCQTAVTGLRRHCITWEESWQRLTCVLRLTGRTLVCINNVTCKFIEIRKKLTKCIVGAVWKKMRWEPAGHVSSEATLAADRGGGEGVAQEQQMPVKAPIRKLITLVLILYL